jgi:transcriptional regulator with XRE-family HTH domain
MLDEGTKTRIFRVAVGLSQHDLAARADLDRRRISEHERGQRTLPAEELARVRAALDNASLTAADKEADVDA